MEYQTFVGNINELPAGKEVELIVRDLTPGQQKYTSSRVLAMLFKESSPGSHTLWVRGRSGVRYSTPFFMKIIKNLPLIK